MSSNNAPTESLREELAERVYQFLRFESESNSQNLSESARESLTVAAECVEQAFELSKPQSERPPSDELLHIYTKYARGEEQTDRPTSKPQQSERKSRKNASSEDKNKAEEFKNQGNELMKQDKHREACELYTKAIELDDNNAVYYSNRAAAYSKMGDHQQALKDCQEAIEIDPTYSKAYGRMGLAYASMDQHEKAKEAYGKASQLDPTNQSYRNNYNIAEEILRSTGTSSGAAPRPDQSNVTNVVNAILSDPNALGNIMQRIQDPAISNIIGNVMSAAMSSNLFPGGSGSPPTTPSTNTSQPSSMEQEATPGEQISSARTDSQAPPPQPQQPNPAAGLTQFLAAGQQIASALQATNPNLMSQIERMFQRPPGQDGNNEGPPPSGYS